MNRLAQQNKTVFLCFVLDDYKKAKYFPLAPIAVEILISRGSAYKIVAEAGPMLIKAPNLSAQKTINRIQVKVSRNKKSVEN